MTDGDALLRAAAAAPDDDAPRLVYADWLDEHGDAARAEFIRVQVELAALPPGSPRAAGLWEREQALLARWRPLWTSDVDGWVNGAVFRRGFIEEVRVSPHVMGARGEEILRRQPTVRLVTVDGASRRDLARLRKRFGHRVRIE